MRLTIGKPVNGQIPVIIKASTATNQPITDTMVTANIQYSK